jgi:hypothetical protein
MPKFNRDNLETQINPKLSNNQQIHVLVTHDETTFHSNDGRLSGWASKGENPLRKKGRGKSIHVSDFLCATIGRLKLNEEQISMNPSIPNEARVLMNIGINNDGWWNIDLLIKQVILFYLFY